MSQLPGRPGGTGTSAPRRPQVAEFRRHLSALTDRDLGTPEALHRWSVEHYPVFWRAWLDCAGLAWEGSPRTVRTSDDVEHARFFPDVRLNYAENLLRPLPGVADDAPALTSVYGDGTAEEISLGELREQVRSTATALAARELSAGDRVVVIAPNNARAAVTVLAAAAWRRQWRRVSR